MTKAYKIDWDDNEFMPKIVWAETSGKAKSMCVYDEELGEPEYLDLTAIRVPWADMLQHLSEYEFRTEWLKHGLSYELDGEGIAYVDFEALPLIEKVGDLRKFEDMYFNNQIIWNEKQGFVEEKND